MIKEVKVLFDDFVDLYGNDLIDCNVVLGNDSIAELTGYLVEKVYRDSGRWSENFLYVINLDGEFWGEVVQEPSTEYQSIDDFKIDDWVELKRVEEVAITSYRFMQ